MVSFDGGRRELSFPSLEASILFILFPVRYITYKINKIYWKKSRLKTNQIVPYPEKCQPVSK
jgi:hypothetical protein